MNINVVGSLGLTTKGFQICLLETKNDLNNLWEDWRSKGFYLPKKEDLNNYLSTIEKINEQSK